ncbi:hypothetical protein AWM68_17330 [Fictibacillus phosphorivorans]|uniref:Uncharacterized protein n=1 Tax=Fictibacillus phosphorivorans TaxID=1221500 RepID=A0A165NW94_9BACL|nr:hypothetical protein [Fictibacillus phosphorivorans]KZE67935.1 hypothetical protein AWM68_17330 [Fictibacillus phosphorivorans]
MTNYTFTDSSVKLADLEENKWYYVEPGRDYSNEVTGVKISENKVFVQYIGGEFDQPFEFWFEYSPDALNEFWQYEFREEYPLEFGWEVDDLDWVNQISSTPYTMLNDLKYSCKYAGLVEREVNGNE